jgi:hypothetical protein
MGILTKSPETNGVFAADLQITQITEIDNNCISFKTNGGTSFYLAGSEKYETIRHECFYEIYSNYLKCLSCPAEETEFIEGLGDSDFTRFILQKPERWEKEER